jgi:hypothetical protein
MPSTARAAESREIFYISGLHVLVLNLKIFADSHLITVVIFASSNSGNILQQKCHEILKLLNKFTRSTLKEKIEVSTLEK